MYFIGIKKLYKSINLRLNVFKCFDILIKRNIIIELNKLFSKYDRNKIYESDERNRFYFEKSLITSPYHYVFRNDEKFKLSLKFYSINYIDGKKYRSLDNVFIKEINGQASFIKETKSPV